MLRWFGEEDERARGGFVVGGLGGVSGGFGKGREIGIGRERDGEVREAWVCGLKLVLRGFWNGLVELLVCCSGLMTKCTKEGRILSRFRATFRSFVMKVVRD